MATASQAKLGTANSFATTQAAWRFYANEKTTVVKLSEPLLAASCSGIANIVKITHSLYMTGANSHGSLANKKDKKALHRYEQGYELQSSIALNDTNGMPLGVLVWQLQQQDTQQANETKQFFVQLSGRQMKKNRPVTSPVLLEGLWLFLTVMDTLDHYSLSQFAEFKQSVYAFWADKDV